MASEPSRSRGKKEIERANQRIVQRHKSSGENDRVDPSSSCLVPEVLSISTSLSSVSEVSFSQKGCSSCFSQSMQKFLSSLSFTTRAGLGLL